MPTRNNNKEPLNTCYASTYDEIGIDEAGRGPMLGRVYSAAVILPREEGEFKHELMKDSKRFSSEKKIRETANYIKENAIAWGIGYATEEYIDKHNIRQATFYAMHDAIKTVLSKLKDDNNTLLLVDGNDFKPYTVFYETNGITQIPHVCITGGDNKYTSIAAASILAKVARDEYIEDLCEQDKSLDERYGIMKNKGYGTKIHMEGIAKYGISKYHRGTFGNCRLHTSSAKQS